MRVEGSLWVKTDPYTVKLEAASLAGYQTSMLAVIRDAHYIRNARVWADKLLQICTNKTREALGLHPKDYDLQIRLIGVDAALGKWEQTITTDRAVEIGVLVLITADSQALATEISRLVNPYLLHLPLTDNEDMPTFAFPYSPAHSERGAIYEFGLNHRLVLDSPTDGFTVKLDRV